MKNSIFNHVINELVSHVILEVLHCGEHYVLIVQHHLEDKPDCFIGAQLGQGMRDYFVDGDLGHVLLG